MSTLRKMKRQMLKDWAREGKKPAEEMAKAAAVELQRVQNSAGEFGQAVLGAAALAVMNDYGKLKNREERLGKLLDLLNSYYLKCLNKELSPKEEKLAREFGILFSERWKSNTDYKKEKEENGSRN